MKNKLLNFTICQVLVVVIVMSSTLLSVLVKCEEQPKMSLSTADAQNVTQYDRSFHKLLSRRKRFLLWRPGSNLLLTASIVKTLAYIRPAGQNVIIEWDIFYPLPATWHVEKPKKAPPPPPPPPPPTTPAPEHDVTETFDDHHHHSGEVWVPPSGWSPDTDVIKSISDDKRRIWSESNIPPMTPLSPPVTQYQNPLLSNSIQRAWQSPLRPSQFRSGSSNNFNQPYYQSNRRFPPSPPSLLSERNFMADNKQREGRSLDDDINRMQMGSTGDSNVNMKDDEYWKYHRAHRDRRDLYDRIGSTSPLSSWDVKSCLLRTICETQHFLMPRGYSLLQDLLRVVFTVPIRDDMKDAYSDAMRSSGDDCVNIYAKKCPISILAFLLKMKS